MYVVAFSFLDIALKYYLSWSLRFGAFLHSMLEGSPPFHNPNSQEIAFKVMLWSAIAKNIGMSHFLSPSAPSTFYNLYLGLYNFYFFISFIYLFIYFWLCWVFPAVCGLSLVAAMGATLPCSAQASHCGGLSCCGARALGVRTSVVVARGL